MLRTTIKLYNGANALTLVEEKIEGDAKVILERAGGRDWLLTRLRAYENDSGDTLLRAVGDDSELRDNDLIEAWSHLGQSYLLGRSTFGAPLQNGRMAEMLQSMSSAGLSSAVNAEAQFWNMVQARAQKLGELHAAGKLDTTMVAELESQLGIGAGTQPSMAWNTETGTATNTQGDEHIAAGGETYNLRSPFEFPGFILRKYHEVLERWKNTRHQENPEFERSYIHLGKTPPVLRVAGANDLPMVVPPGLFRKVTEDSHAVPIEALEALPQSLADPVAVFQSRREGDSILVLTEYEEPGKGPIVITVRLDQKADHGWVINKVTSVYGRPQGDIMSMFNEVPLYVNPQKRKSLGWAQRAGKQYSGRAFHTQGQSKVSSPEDVVKWTQEQQISQAQNKLGQNQESPALRGAGEVPPETHSLVSRGDSIDSPALLNQFYLNEHDALTKAHQTFGGPQGLLRSAAQAVTATGADDAGGRPTPPGDNETDALTRFARKAGLMLDSAGVRQYMEQNAMKGGAEHRVAHILSQGRVLKDLDAHALATESLYDYLSDLQLSNAFFGDGLRIEGFYQHLGRLHVVTSQPFIKGVHLDWPGLIAGLIGQGLVEAYPGSHSGAFVIPDTEIGDLDVIDLHTNNVILGEEGWLHPIDAHFYFDDLKARRAAMKSLGLDD
ncbi:MAG: hypothetical protein ACO1TE_13980 [Prosthecobacter sp.]